MDDLIEDFFAFLTCADERTCPDCGEPMVQEEQDVWQCPRCGEFQ